jgi:signal transduction histidine kinase
MDQHSEITVLRLRVSQLEREKEAVEGFAAVAAHELLTPMVMIDACAATIHDRLDGVRDAESLRDLDTLRRGAARSRLLVETLLHDARLRERPLKRRPVDLGVIVPDCLALLAPEIRVRAATVELGELPRVCAEGALLSAVFMNLLFNALKYGPRRGGTIRVGARSERGGWRVSVRSEGQPIRPADRERIFQAYQRGSGERRVPGAGLGLAICRQIVERHGGEIAVAPTEAGENDFTFTLPA